MDKQKEVMALCLCCAGKTSVILVLFFIASQGTKKNNQNPPHSFLLCLVICSPVFTEVKVSVPRSLNALRTSCVVIPCFYTPLGETLDTSSLKGIWYRLKKDIKEVVYDEDQSRVEEHFRDRTQLLGHLGQRNCTLEMLNIAEHDAGQYCFTMGQQEEKTSCVKLQILCTSPLPSSVISNTLLIPKFNTGLLSPPFPIHR